MECYYHLSVSDWETVFSGDSFQIRRTASGDCWLIPGAGSVPRPIAIKISREEMESILSSPEPDEAIKRIDLESHQFANIR